MTIRNAALFLFCDIAYGPGTNALSALGAYATSASHAVLLLSLFPPGWRRYFCVNGFLS
ncbi:hypothetical protein [Bradyrhizobium japonicum]|uniref:hypothetical protein n=1 Tax=Bradyrhizobium japonicum TaxID=375 RepID=UPI000313CF71|nr:hypothetical protein [Bradyrhizobium japonicum]